MGTTVDIEVKGEGNVGFDVYDSFGEELLSEGGDYSIAVSGTFTIEHDEPHFLVARQYSEDLAELRVNSSQRLTPFTDSDDGRWLNLNQLTYGNIDFPDDTDYYLLTLRKGQTVEVNIRSALSDPFTLIDFHGADDAQIIVDDDGGGGLFGTDSRIVYQAPHSGDYLVVTYNAEYGAPGGYTIDVRDASANSALTETTRALLFDNEDGDTSTGFGQYQLRAAFVDLPGSFEELDPSDLGISISDFGFEEYGLEFLSEVVSFGNAEPLQWFMAFSGELSVLEEVSLSLLSQSQEFLDGFREGLNLTDEDFIVTDSGLLRNL